MYKKEYGNPIVALRLPPAMIVGAKIGARQHQKSMSAYIRDIIADQLDKDGVTWQNIKPLEGQMRIEDE